MMYYLPIIIHPEGVPERPDHPIADRDQAMRWLYMKKQMDPAGDTWFFYHADPQYIEDKYLDFLSTRVEEKRNQMELGEPGDHDEPYRFAVPDLVKTQLEWAHLMARAQAGEIGGAFDGDRV